MRKPENYDSAEAVEGGFSEPKAGPCILGIVNATVEVKNGEQRVIFNIDIAEGKFKNHFGKQTKRFGKNRLLRYYQNAEGKSLPYFKGVIKAIEESNPGYVFDWNESGLALKKVGGNLREEEYLANDGTIKTILRIGYLCSIRSVLEGEHRVMSVKKFPQGAAAVPEEKHYQRPGENDEPLPTNYEQSIPEGEEPIPF
jgi:hypothetical protein